MYGEALRARTPELRETMDVSWELHMRLQAFTFEVRSPVGFRVCVVCVCLYVYVCVGFTCVLCVCVFYV